MKLRRPRAETKYTGYVGDYADKLSRMRPIRYDDEQLPTREDLRYGETLFSRSPAPLPRSVRRSKRRG
jgi:hypothetical protein